MVLFMPSQYWACLRSELSISNLWHLCPCITSYLYRPAQVQKMNLCAHACALTCVPLPGETKAKQPFQLSEVEAMSDKPWQTLNRSFDSRAINTAGSSRASWSMTVICLCLRDCTHTQRGTAALWIYHSYWLSSLQEQQENWVVVSLFWQLQTLSTHSRAHTHKPTTQITYTDKIPQSTRQNRMPHVFLTDKLISDEFLPISCTHARTPTQSTVEFITHTPPEARVPNPVTVC